MDSVPNLTQWRAGGERRGVNGVSLFVRTGGAGPHLTLLHGFPTCSWDWSRIWPTLEARRSLLALDLLGFGGSDKPLVRYRFASHADRLQALWSDLGIRSTVVVAHDYSVTLAQELLAREREGRLEVELRGVLFLNGALRGRLHRARLIQKMLAGPLGPMLAHAVDRKQFARSFRAVFVNPPTEVEIDDFWASICERGGNLLTPRLLHYIADRRAGGPRWEGALETTSVQRAMIWGVEDPVSGAHVLESVQHLGETRRLPVGHYPHWEAPGEVARAILELSA